jgi:hypothetical protein
MTFILGYAFPVSRLRFSLITDLINLKHSTLPVLVFFMLIATGRTGFETKSSALRMPFVFFVTAYRGACWVTPSPL